MKSQNQPPRRNFIRNSALLSASLMASQMTSFAQPMSFKKEKSMYLIGPQDGYSPQVGTLLSTMTMMRSWIIRQVEDLTQEQLDFQIDDKSNSIGAMLYHLAATEKYYQLNTFDDMKWGSWNDDVKKEWDVPMQLGTKARQQIKGNDIDFYLTILADVRKVTEKGFAKRDDKWIMKSEPFFEDKPTNNYCKWFHVCEHESNHNGQIKFIKGRFPGG